MRKKMASRFSFHSQSGFRRVITSAFGLIFAINLRYVKIPESLATLPIPVPMQKRRNAPTNTAIAKAIEQKELLSFIYNGHRRLVEPHTYGISSTGKESLLAYQVKGGHSSGHHEPWHLFSTSKMLGMVSTGQPFEGPRKSYKRTWPPMRAIYIQL